MTLTLLEFLAEDKPTGQVWDYISPSRLSLWLRCPLAFRRRYIDGEPTTDSPAFFVGKMTHSVLAYLYQQQMDGIRWEADDLCKYLSDTWQEVTAVRVNVFDDAEQETKARQQVWDLVACYIKDVPVNEEVPMAIEQRYEEPLINPQTGENYGIPLVGIVDLVLKDDNTLVDFKTSATCSLCELQHEIQLTAYSYLFRQVTGRNEGHCEIRQLVKTKTPKIACHSFAQRGVQHFDRFFGLVREYLDALDSGRFTYRPSWTCGTCEHLGDCCR